MQFAIALIAAHACVSSRPAFRFLDWLASRPDVDRPVQAVVLLGLFSIVVAYFNWAASVVASALFLPFVARRNPRADIRILIAAGYLGLGTVWHGGLSGSAPLIMATAGNPITTPPARGRAPRRPAAAGDRDPVQRLQPRLPRGRLGRRPRHGRGAAPAPERADADRGRAGADHAGDARGDRADDPGGGHRGVPGVDLPRRAPDRLSPRALHRDPGVRGELDHQRLQRGVPDGGDAAAAAGPRTSCGRSATGRGRRRGSSCSSRSTRASSGSSTAPPSATGWAGCSCRWRPRRPIR